MKFLFPRAVSFIVTALCALHSMTSAQRHIVIPRPVEEKYSTGSFILDRKTEIATISSNQELAPVAEYLGNFLEKGTGFVLPSLANGKTPKSNYILLEQDASLGNEGYELTVQKGSVRLRGGDQAGVFYAVQSLLQIMPPEIFRRDGLNKVAWKIPCATIIDKPRFPWRGMHLDVCRHFFPIEFVKRYIDFLAIYKMNTFHWHLTDDQGWRIEIKRYPKLTEVGGWRNGSMVGPYYNMKFDTIRYGGFFTQAQIREVVAYAASRYITVVPEIEMPGHALAALASYPELSCTGGPFEVGKAWGVFDDVFCPKETTFTFLENVLSEVCELFPGKYIHVGGDECPKVRWKECSSCQDLMKKEGLKDEEQLQSYFVSRIEKFLNTKGKNIIGWDEILQGGLAPNASVMSWRGTEGGIAAAKQHHNVVMTPGDYCYFDHYQGNPKYQPLAIGGYTTVEKVYWYDPVPSQLKPAERKYILGAQGNLWAEYITTPQQMEYMALPRMAALAEVDWSLPKNKNYQEFRGRLIRHFKVLDYVGANYSKALYEMQTGVRPGSDRKGVELTLSSPFGREGIRYTTDGSEPTLNSPRYKGPIGIMKNTPVNFAYFRNGTKAGSTFTQQFVVSLSTGKKIKLKTEANSQYRNSGAFTLVDGINGDVHSYGRDWLGFWGPDLNAVIDLQRATKFSAVTVGIFQNEGSWIYFPKHLEVLGSDDNVHFVTLKRVAVEDSSQGGKNVEIYLGSQSARYVKVIAENAGTIPSGKPGAGDKAWLFVDEISIK